MKRTRSNVVSSGNNFTSIETELEKPSDGSDVTTPRSSKQEVQRLRKIIYSESKRALHAEKDRDATHDKLAATNALLYGQEQVDQPEKTANPTDTAAADATTTEKEGASCLHIDTFEDRRQKKRAVNSKMRKLKDKNFNTSAKDILTMMQVTHKLARIVQSSVAHKEGKVLHSTSEDPHEHVQSLIHSDYHDTSVAVLVSDLSGFTSTTRKYGIVHFASIIVRMRQLVLPIFSKYKALNITTEADNFITIFPDSISAVSAALEMQQILLKYNASLSEARQHYKVKLNGIGVGCGVGVLLDNEGKLHGEPANEAYHIGEDICEGGVVLITAAVAEEIGKEGR